MPTPERQKRLDARREVHRAKRRAGGITTTIPEKCPDCEGTKAYSVVSILRGLDCDPSKQLPAKLALASDSWICANPRCGYNNALGNRVRLNEGVPESWNRRRSGSRLH